MKLSYSGDRRSPLNTERWLYQLALKRLAVANMRKEGRGDALANLNRTRARLARLVKENQGIPVNYPEEPHLETTVAGIPCGVVIDHCTTPRDWKQHTFPGAGPGDCDPPEHGDCDWHLVDRHGYRAEWLERKMTSDDIDEIKELIISGRWQDDAL